MDTHSATRSARASYPLGHPKPRLLYIINWDWYFRVHWLERAKAASQAGYDVWILVPNTNQAEIDRIRSEGFPVIETTLTRKGLNPLKELLTLARLSRAVARLSPDLIHNVTIKPNVYGSTISRILNIPAVNSITGLGFTFIDRSIKGRLLRVLVSNLYRIAWGSQRCHLLFENQEDRKFLISRRVVREAQTTLIPGAGVDPDLYSYKDEPASPPVRILFAGRILWDKGILELVEASRILQRRQLKFEIIVAGIIDSGNLSVVSESQILQWHRKRFITWIGYEDNMPALLKSVHIVVLPSYYGEGIPRILIEAASCGRPCITTDMPGCRAIVKDQENGLLVAPRDPNSLATALERLIKNPDLRMQMGKRGRQIVVESFSQQIVVEQTLAVYRNVLAS